MSDDVTVVSESENAYSESNSDIFPDYFGPGSQSELGGEESSSRSLYLATLKLNKVRPEQKGVYKCGPSNTRSASVELHITDGKLYLPTHQLFLCHLSDLRTRDQEKRTCPSP